MFRDIRKFADWLVFGPEADDEEGFTEATVDGQLNNKDSALNQGGSVRRVVSQEQKNADKNIHDSGGGLIDLQCGKRVFNDVPAKMRTELWLSKLHSHTTAGAPTPESAYQMFLEKFIDDSVLTEIERDIHRTFPGHLTLSSKAGQRAMSNVLRAYAAFDPEVGYSQGMNFLSGMLLTYLSPPQAFSTLVLVMQDRGLREYYKPNGMVHLQARLWQLSKLIPPELELHLERNMVLPVLYASSWFLTCFASEFPITFAARVMDVIITDSYHLPIMKVSMKILERCKDEILLMNGMEEIIDLIRKQVPSWPESALQDLLTSSLGTSWTSSQLDLLQNSNSMAETVAEALQRIEQKNEKDDQINEIPDDNLDGSHSWTPEWTEPITDGDNMGRTTTVQPKSTVEDPKIPVDLITSVSSETKSHQSPFVEANLLDSDVGGDLDQPKVETCLSDLQNLSMSEDLAPERRESTISYQNSMKSLLHNFSMEGPDISVLRDIILSQSINFSQVGDRPIIPASIERDSIEKGPTMNESSEFGEWQSS